MNSPLSIIVSREYLERVKRKSFIISTILVPLFMLLVMVAPAAFLMLSEPESKVVAVVDQTGLIAPRLQSNDEIRFIVTNESIDSLRADATNDIIVSINEGAIDQPERFVTIYTHGSLTLMTSSYISGQINKAIRDTRIDSYDIPGIRQIIRDVQVNVTSYPTIRIDKEEDVVDSSAASYFISLAVDMALYMFILIYGQMVMNSIIEEKNNRVLELVVSSVKPKTLMLGKILGIGAVALTQILIWAVLLGGASYGLTAFTGGILEQIDDAEVAGAIGMLSDPVYVVTLFGYLMLFFIGGYLFYSAIYAAIASAVDNVQDAGQLSSVATMPIIVAIMASMAVINNPSSTLAFWLSVIPFTSPMCMMARLPFEVPFWEIALSLVVLYASFMVLIWLCAKIYRVGIFMYGKKPTLVEILRWARYK